MSAIQLIVEGDGDEHAMPVLVRRILHDHGHYHIQLPKPHKRGELHKVKSRFRDYLETAILEGHPVLCVLDFDCETCVDVLAEERALVDQALLLRPDHPFAACFLVKEYESLFLTDTDCIRHHFPQIKKDHVFPSAPETVRDAKGEISRALPTGYAYKPTVHQAKLSAAINLTLLRQHSPSFHRLEQAVLQLAQS